MGWSKIVGSRETTLSAWCGSEDLRLRGWLRERIMGRDTGEADGIIQLQFGYNPSSIPVGTGEGDALASVDRRANPGSTGREV